MEVCRGGETGRRERLKISCPQGCVGSIPTPGTIRLRPVGLRRDWCVCSFFVTCADPVKSIRSTMALSSVETGGGIETMVYWSEMPFSSVWSRWVAAMCCAVLALLATPVAAHEAEVDVHVFVREGCPHCAAEKEFFADWSEVAPVYHEVTERESQELFRRLQQRVPGLQQAVPITVVDGKVLQGFDIAETTGRRFRTIVEACTARPEGCQSFASLLSGTGTTAAVASGAGCDEGCEGDPDAGQFLFDLWWIGEVNLRLLSLPTLAVVLGGLDGFNPCAMWVLISLLTLLINTRSLRTTCLVTGIFLLVSGIMYYVFIAAWLHTFLLIGVNWWLTKIIGLMAVGGGSFYLYQVVAKDPNACKVTDLQQRQRVMVRMHAIMSATSLPAMLVGVAVLAFSVNLFEIVCTAGLPAIFAQILALNDLSLAQYHGLLLLYVLTYMFDDVIIFSIAIATLHCSGLTTRYRRFTLIFGGFLMLVLGFLLLFKPDVLVLG